MEVSAASARWDPPLGKVFLSHWTLALLSWWTLHMSGPAQAQE